ncbi:MAG: hypothetical protein ACR2I8_00935 [Steroidobacteraceae bacterium]
MPQPKPPSDDSVPPGRIEHDERGQAVWKPATEVRSEDTVMRLLKPEELALLDGGQDGFNPYGHEAPDTVAPPVENKRGRTDLRKLSEQILAERARAEKKP